MNDKDIKGVNLLLAVGAVLMMRTQPRKGLCHRQHHENHRHPQLVMIIRASMVDALSSVASLVFAKAG